MNMGNGRVSWGIILAAQNWQADTANNDHMAIACRLDNEF
jgi:hypothetical protein